MLWSYARAIELSKEMSFEYVALNYHCPLIEGTHKCLACPPAFLQAPMAPLPTLLYWFDDDVTYI